MSKFNYEPIDGVQVWDAIKGHAKEAYLSSLVHAYHDTYSALKSVLADEEQYRGAILDVNGVKSHTAERHDTRRRIVIIDALERMAEQQIADLKTAMEI